MRAVQTLWGEYQEEEIYTMDETGLYWRASPSQGLTVRAQPGKKRERSRISIACCCNFTGRRRFPLWLIGEAIEPRGLRNINLGALRIEWNANKKAWMTAAIMRKWLRAFYVWIGSSQKALLLMDSFSAHIKAVEFEPPPSNIRVQWLPTNATSLYQPLDQGIIQNLKHLYKRHWLQFMLKDYEQRRNPLETMSLFYAVQWISQAWFYEVPEQTIYSCFRKTRVEPTQAAIQLPTAPPPEIDSLYRAVQQAGSIADAMTLSNFLYPADEGLKPSENPEARIDMDDVINSHLDRTEADDEDEISIEVPSSTMVLQMLESIMRYEVLQKYSTPEAIEFLHRLRRTVEDRVADSTT